jgi:hypothetical protein
MIPLIFLSHRKFPKVITDSSEEQADHSIAIGKKLIALGNGTPEVYIDSPREPVLDLGSAFAPNGLAFLQIDAARSFDAAKDA